MTFSSLAPVSVDVLTQRIFSRREKISPRLDVLWRIERGAVRTLTYSEQGKLITLGCWGPGDVVGAALSRVQPYEIECLTSVEVSILPQVLWFRAVDAMVLHLQQLEELLSVMHQETMALRLWQFLQWLGQKFGRHVEQGLLIDLGLTHQQLAEAINATRVSVTRTLKQLESQGMLLRLQKRIILSDPSSCGKITTQE